MTSRHYARCIGRCMLLLPQPVMMKANEVLKDGAPNGRAMLRMWVCRKHALGPLL